MNLFRMICCGLHEWLSGTTTASRRQCSRNMKCPVPAIRCPACHRADLGHVVQGHGSDALAPLQALDWTQRYLWRGAAVVGGEPHRVTSSSLRMAGWPRAPGSAYNALPAPSIVNKFPGKAVPSRRHFKQSFAASFDKLGFASECEALVGKIPAVANLDHLIDPSIGPIKSIYCRAITAYWAMVPTPVERDGHRHAHGGKIMTEHSRPRTTRKPRAAARRAFSRDDIDQKCESQDRCSVLLRAEAPLSPGAYSTLPPY